MSSRRLSELGDGHRWDEADGRAALKAWCESGLSGQEFADEHGFNPQRLFWWKKRLGEAGAVADDEQQLRFVPAHVVGGAGVRSASVMVRGPDGVAIEIDGDSVSPMWVAALVRELAKA